MLKVKLNHCSLLMPLKIGLPLYFVILQQFKSNQMQIFLTHTLCNQ